MTCLSGAAADGGECWQGSDCDPLEGAEMVGSTDDRRRAVDALLRDFELKQAALDGAALFVVADASVLWASPAAALLLGPDYSTTGAVSSATLPLDRLTALAADLPLGAAPRLERARFLSGRQVIVRTLACRAIALDDGRRALAATVIGLKGVPVDLAQAKAEPEPSEPPAPVPYSLEELRARAGGRSVLRFVWHSGEGARFVAAAPELRDLLGGDLPETAGRTWSELVHLGVHDVGGAVAAALERSETFHALATLWPIEAGRSFIVVHLSGVPALDREHRLVGFRGFGLCRLDRLEPAPDVAAPVVGLVAADLDGAGPRHSVDIPAPGLTDAPPDREFPLSPAASLNDEIAWLSDHDARLKEPLPSPVASEPEPAPERPSAVVPFSRVRGSASGNLASSKVVQLRGPAISGPPAPTGLSRSERHAFREIARALGARIEGDESEASRPATAAEPPLQSTPAAPDNAHPPATGSRSDPPSPEAPAVAAQAPEVRAPEDQAPEVQAPEPAPLPVVEPVASGSGQALADAAALMDRLPLGVLVCRGDVALAANKTLLDMLGYADLAQFEVHGGIATLFRGRSAETLAVAAERGSVAVADIDGDILAVDVRIQTLDWQGAPATLLSLSRAPETEASPKLKALELDLRRREAESRELRAILDTATDGVIVLDDAGRILTINRSAEALFGYDQNEVAGETFISLLAPESHAAAMDYHEGLKANGVASVMNDGREVIGRVRQGGRIPLFMTLGRISDSPEPKFCAVLRDITPWKRAEGDLVEAKRAAEKSSAQKSDFLAKISHEIRTPLSAIIGFAEVMMEERFGAIGNERYKDYLKDIHTSGGHVISLVNDLLDLSKIEAGRFELNFTSVDVNDIVGSCVSLMQPQASEARVVVRSSLAPQLPRVVADERSIRQIVLNILSNAVRFTDPGGQVIVSTAFTDRGEVVMRVRDTGIGMSENEIETALEPFRQIATPGRSGGGTGLGLPLTKALVEANRATLIIRSAKQAGTLVEIIFPTTRVLAE
jgi:PAS domain S-box-containing protein